MRGLPLALIALALLLVPAAAARRDAAPRVAIFYYPWYGTPARDGKWQHWQQHGHNPPADIASAFYPVRSPYSSSDPNIIAGQMRDLARAGIGELVSSWWGRGSPEDARLPAVLRAAHAAGLAVAAHLEPYDGRTIAGTALDIAYLRTLGINDFFAYNATDFTAAEWAPVLARFDGARFFAQTTLAGFAKAGGFTGMYTYDIVTNGGGMFGRFCTDAHRQGLLCLPSVGPGFDARRATGNTHLKPRRAGKTYDAMWTAALRAQPDLVTITSYNEWLEGTEIEPAQARPGYASFDGAWGAHGAAARTAYLARTRYWVSRFGRQHLG
ncbi:MAG: glycoside hydrolase family 71/99 protein [Gaiellaceae bacterium]